MDKIILASASERRESILTQAGYVFERIPGSFDENHGSFEQISPYDMVKELSLKKGQSVLDAYDFTEKTAIISADTAVYLRGKTLGKPRDNKDAAEMLRLMHGRVHSVYTGVSIIVKDGVSKAVRTLVDTTSVKMRRLTEAEIRAYIETGEPMGKAGAYAIQGKGALLVEAIDGDYNNVVGLPVSKLYFALKEMGVDTGLWL